MGFLRPYWIALAGMLALFLPAPSSAQRAPIDPVSGLAIPLLPGQTFAQVKSGCWMIDSVFNAVYLRVRWIGGCRYGVIDGPGLLVYPGYDGKPGTHVQVRAHLGYVLQDIAPDRVIIPRTTDRPLWEVLSISRRNIDGQTDMLDPNVSAATVGMMSYHSRDNAFRDVREDLSFHKKSCPTDSTNSRDIKNYFSPESFNPDGFSERDISRLAEFCVGAVKRLRQRSILESVLSDPLSAHKSFDNVDYGHYHFASVRRQVESLRYDGQIEGTAGALVSKTTPSLCPDLSTPSGCEAVWQGLLAPYEAKFAQLKKQEAAAEAARRADTERRFAPLKQAWSKRIAELRAPARGD